MVKGFPSSLRLGSRVIVFALSTGLILVGGVFVLPPQIASAQTVTNCTGTGIDWPFAIAAGSDGALWFTNYLNNSVGRITTGGVVTNYTGTGIDYPTGIAAGPDGALWFSNLINPSRSSAEMPQK